MQIVRTKAEINDAINDLKSKKKIVGLVPTMGFLHAGHVSLIEKSKSQCDLTVLSIFVNPFQFGKNEDFNRYPRNFEKDRLLALKKGVDIIFYPEPDEMYSANHLTCVNVTKMEKIMCGRFRPGHFRGVCTVVLKLLNIIKPDKAYFGQKDFQQLIIIKKMISDLDIIDVEIVECDTIREEDGLALSSRNAYLNPEERKNASILYRAISLAAEEIKKGRSPKSAKHKAVELLKSNCLIKKIDYFDIRNPENLELVKKAGPKDKRILVASAVWLGTTRLIDNKIVNMTD